MHHFLDSTRRRSGSDPLGLLAWIQRTTAMFASVMLIASIATAATQLELVDPLWELSFGLGIAGLTIWMLVATFRVGAVFWPMVVFSGAVVLATLTWPCAWRGGINDQQPWVWNLLGISCVVTVLALGVRWALGQVALQSAAWLWIGGTASGGGDTANALGYVVILAFLPTAMILIVGTFLRALRQVEVSFKARDVQLQRAAAEESLASERRRLDAIVHDEVMTTLAAAAQAPEPRNPQLANAARLAMRTLDEAAMAPDATGPVTGAQFVWLLEDLVATVSPDIKVSSRHEGTRPLELPQRVATAITAAVREACVNAERHAGPAQIWVLAVTSTIGETDGVLVRVSDDGMGFDPSAIPPERLGLRLSVEGRMASIGGTVEVMSATGYGTSVALSWQGAPDEGEERPRWHDSPIRETFRRVPLLLTFWALVLLDLGLGIDSWSDSVVPLATGTAMALALLAGGMTSVPRGAVGMERWRGPVIVVLITFLTALGIFALRPGLPLGHAYWFMGITQYLLAGLLFARDRRWVLVGLGSYTTVVVLWAMTQGRSLTDVALLCVSPLAWTAAGMFTARTWERIDRHLDAAHSEGTAASRLSASGYAAIVLRDAWLNQLRTRVDGLLGLIADEKRPLSAEERQECLRVEHALRDSMRAANLTSPGVDTAIAGARTRGVDVTLVDNRGQPLPATARRAALRELVSMAEAASMGRIIARTAPAGDPDCVTILRVAPGGSTHLVSIDAEGAITERSKDA